MKAPMTWLGEFAPLPSDLGTVARAFARCGFAVDGVEGDVLDLDVTANRPDCLSMYGLAREAATSFDVALVPAGPLATLPEGQAPIGASISDSECGRYALAVLDVAIRPSPTWLAGRLVAAGVRPINNIVDVTNYVMLELGQPMHAFDAARLAGGEIRVRRATAGERLVTIDGDTRTLDASMLVIADRDAPVALAGVMGGRASEVSSGTSRLALESAWFQPGTVRATSRRLSLKTEASARFERGADPDIAIVAIRRAVALFEQIGAGRLVGGVSDFYPAPHRPPTVTLRRERLARLLGVEVPDTDVVRILSHLGFTLESSADGWRVQVPSFRVDVSREADLIEEIGRHWGLDRIPATFPSLASAPRPSDAGVIQARFLRRVLTGAGLQEAMTFTFVEEALAAPFAGPAGLTAIKNPLSEKFAVMRPSLAPGLVESLAYNLNRQAADVRLFEMGSVFSPDRGERTAVGWIMTGSRGDHWSGSSGPLTFADTKGIAEALAAACGVAISTEMADDLSWLRPGRRAALVDGANARVGWIGQLTTSRIDVEVYAGELDLAALAVSDRAGRAIEPLPRFPVVVRDLSIVVDERLPAADVRGTIRSNAPTSLASLGEFDRYQGKGVPDGKVSLSLRLTFQHPDRTLTDADVQQAMDTIVQVLASAHGAVLR